MRIAINTRRAFLSLEVIFTIGLVLGVLSFFVFSLTGLTQHNDVMLARQRAFLAAEATLNEIRAGLEPDRAAFSERFGDLTVDVRRAPADGPWSGFQRVVVSVETVAGAGTPVRVWVGGYVRETEQ